MHTIYTSLFTLSLTTLYTLPTSSLHCQTPLQPIGAWVYLWAPELWLSGEMSTGDHRFWGAGWNIVNISVTYKSMARKGEGNDAQFWHNDMSWSLFCLRKGCTLWHSNMATTIASTAAGKLGVGSQCPWDCCTSIYYIIRLIILMHYCKCKVLLM